jgi:ABC-type transport system substrate-binding protein
VTDGAPDQGTEGIRFMGYTLYDPLVAWDLSSATEPAKLVPGLATKWYQDPADPTKWIFELRQGVKFHHGAPFTADDVIFSLERTLNDKSPAFDRLGRSVLIAAVWPIVAYRKIDDYKVELQTSGIDTVMPSLLNRFPISSADNFEKVGKDWQAYRKSPSGSLAVGPRRLDRGTRARLARQAQGRRLQDRDECHPAHVALYAQHVAGRADRGHSRTQGDEPCDRSRRHREGAERARRARRRLRALGSSVVRLALLQDQVRPNRG